MTSTPPGRPSSGRSGDAVGRAADDHRHGARVAVAPAGDAPADRRRRAGHRRAPRVSPSGTSCCPAYRPSWSGLMPAALAEMAARGANAVIFTPTWTLQVNRPLPILGLDPTQAPFGGDLLGFAAEAAKHGMQVGLRPRLAPAYGSLADWWTGGARDAAWWAVWYEAYRSFILTQARLASEAGATTLILGGPEIAPALPDWPPGRRHAIRRAGGCRCALADADRRSARRLLRPRRVRARSGRDAPAAAHVPRRRRRGASGLACAADARRAGQRAEHAGDGRRAARSARPGRAGAGLQADRRCTSCTPRSRAAPATARRRRTARAAPRPSSTWAPSSIPTWPSI